MKTVIPIYKNRISPVFDWCRNLLLVEIQSGRELGRSKVAAANIDQVRQADQLVELGVGLVVCGGISKTLIGLLETRGIRTISGVSGNIDDVVAALRTEVLLHPRFVMPGFSGYRGGRNMHGSLGGKNPNVAWCCGKQEERRR